MSCSLCQTRKEKRFCPALHERICTQCCGTEREQNIDCVADCTYLVQAREHEKPRAIEDLHDEELFREIPLDQRHFYDHEPLITGLLYGMAKLVMLHKDWTDRDVIHALTEVTKAAATRANSGLILQESTPNPVQQVLHDDIQKMVAQYRQLEEQHLGYAKLKDSDVMRALVFLVRMAHSRTNGRRKSRAFVHSLQQQFPAANQGVASSSSPNSGLIIP